MAKQPSRYQSRQFTINYGESLAQGGNWISSIDVAAQNYRHTISAFGGFDAATFDLVEKDDVLEDWVSNGLGRTIIVNDDSLMPMWEGFVNQITINQAGLTVVYGPLTDITNKVFGVYSTVDTTKDPPEVGERKNSTTHQDLISQGDWGIWPEILSLAGVTDANAEQLVAMYLVEHKDPETSSNFSFGNNISSITIDCVGWYQTLIYPFNKTNNTGTIALSTRITQILDAQVNVGYVSPDYSHIATNTTPIKAYENDDQKAVELLRGLTAMGDSNDARYIFGVYEDRKAYYEPASIVIDYEIRLKDENQVILDASGAVVPPWRVRPGRYTFFADYMPSLGSPPIDLHTDRRMLQIEQIQFDVRTPFSVQLTGGHTSKYEQKSARLGLRGIDV